MTVMILVSRNSPTIAVPRPTLRLTTLRQVLYDLLLIIVANDRSLTLGVCHTAALPPARGDNREKTCYILMCSFSIYLRYRPMDNLSGGEKTVSALALLFAIHK